MREDIDIYAVNHDTNKQWQHRFTLVGELAAWVFDNLNPDHVSWDDSVSDKKATSTGRQVKARQYVYEHLAVGKMLFPVEDKDPLFTCAQFRDDSMILQLNHGKYPAFQREVCAKYECLQDFDPSSVADVDWADLEKEMNEPTRRNAQNLRYEMCARWHEVDTRSDWADRQMVGLVLRYKCMGAFSDNLHGSVPDSWSRALSREYVECFASPFNHKFETYYSIYEQDRIFGSHGNFFSMIRRNQGLLPDFGKYEINPPWNNQMYEKVYQIMANTMKYQVMVEAIIVGPNWSDTRWIPGITGLITQETGGWYYHEHSFCKTRVLPYVNDNTGRPFNQDTVFWVITQAELEPALLRSLKLNR